MKNWKFKASQHLIKRDTSNHLKNLADFWIIGKNENISIDDDKYTRFSKTLDTFIPFKN